MRLAIYLLRIKHQEEDSLKDYLFYFNKEQLTTEDNNMKIILTALLEGILTSSPFMAELAKETLLSLRKIMDKTDEFFNTKDTMQDLITPQRISRRKEGK